ncbi:hypothetical protein GCM10011351_00920 [Paraliobacillus quinghaiensis]|uniref:Uncharacterized protein n=1 Tax=Paraliobacillus quinghaiensis TaxID=470815 RepID=A0A917TDJ7_9BACI|nr:hypothetical protein [Paraliobacillus quinghaiensis]GGM18969.1 hypothetical protein GCM10011351_00920 [Paraliobacillus quinghaiensis]
MKKIFTIGALIIGFVLLILFYQSGDPLEPIRELREGTVENIEMIDTVTTENGTMVYAVGEANSGKNSMYTVDMVRNGLTGYKWVGGGGHVNQDVPMNDPFVLSLQVLSEEQDINPTMLGVVKDTAITGITVVTRNESADATFYEVIDGENFYVIPFDENVSDLASFRISIEGKGNSTVIISGEDMARLQEGKSIYLNEEDLME